MISTNSKRLTIATGTLLFLTFMVSVVLLSCMQDQFLVKAQNSVGYHRRWPCRRIKCYKYCRWGYVYDRWGCKTCRCKKRPCRKYYCWKHCKYGFLKDKYGCQIGCRCKRKPW